MSVDGDFERLRTLGVRLKDAGTEGRGLQRELRKGLKAAADPLAKKIDDEKRMDPYMPDRYAGVLSRDLDVKVRTSISGDPKVTIEARAREHRRKIGQIEDGYINHPVFARGPRRLSRSMGRSLAVREKIAREHGIPVSAVRGWTWVKPPQTKGMRPGFFSDPCEESAPDVRKQLLQAMADTDRKITDGR